ncbi:Ras guanine nucleotide exchange factor [Planoprotostelium fungivorum]|uniref:Ras guanine nucleotide exchange factor n=1 Tax=Planoprotostelium fungivorum TaxID=1890364 RepID=A0A2P6MXK9_9EUKA|nr:Ras guanine nucleotide exchange factor [Planoprotostelium fungivorum]PRP76413.1 Ras guanine nucleotide exchange factor [Planoprotostelium fungivorum]
MDSHTFVARIVDVCKKIMSETKGLRELGDQRNEDMLLEPTKRTAVVTFELVDLVREHVNQNCVAAGFTEDDHSVAEYYFLENTNEVRSSVLALIDAIKSGVANPFDYMSQQNVDNAIKEVVNSITQIVTYVKDSTKEADSSTFAKQDALVNNIRSANVALSSMAAAFDSNDQVSFTNASKVLITSVRTLVEFSRDQDLGMEDEMKACTIDLIQAAKTAIQSDDQESDGMSTDTWNRAKTAVSELFERLILRTINALKCSNGPLGRTRWGYLMKSTQARSTPASPAVQFVSPPTSPNPTTTTVPINRMSLPAKKTSLPPPPIQRSQSKWEAVQSPTLNKPLEKSSKFLSARGAVESVLSNSNSDSLPPPTANPLMMSASGVPIRMVPIPSLPQPAPEIPKKPTTPTNDQREIAQRIITSLTGHFPSFKNEWSKLNQDSTEKLMKSLIMDHLPAGPVLQRRLTRRGSQTEEDEDLADLRKLLDNNNQNDITKMSYELKCLTRRLEKKSRQQQTLGRAFSSKNNLEALASAEYQPDITDLEGTLKDCMRDYREAVQQFTSTLGSNVIAAYVEAWHTEGGEPRAHHAVTKVYRDLLLLMVSRFEKLRLKGGQQEAAKLGQYWIQNHKEPSVTKDGTKTLSEKKREALKQKENFQNSVKTYTLNYISLTQGILEKAQTKGKANQYIINLITESEGESEEYITSLKTKLEELVHNHLIDDINTVRSLTAQVVGTLKHMTSKRANESAVMQMCALLRNTLDASTTILNNFETFMYITKPDFSKNSSSGKNIKGALDVTPGGNKRTRNLWLEQSQLLRNTDEILGGTLNQIIIYLTGESADQLFIKTFLLTYQSFTNPYTLLEKLEQRYAGPPPEAPQQAADNFIKIKMRVGVVLKVWIEMQFDDFDPALSRKLQMFITDVLAKEQAMKEMAIRLMKEVEKRSSEQAARIEAKKTHTQYALDIKAVDHDLSAYEFFMRTKEEDIARQLTVIEFGIFKQIKATEFLNQAWNNMKLKHKSPHVLHLIARANKISFWVASIILCQSKVIDRARVIERFVRIGECLLKLNNFNSLIAIIAGLNVSAISRLKITWDAVEKPYTDLLKKLQSIFDPGNSNRSYRKERNEATSKGMSSVMPYIGVTLSDLTFAEDGNPDFLQDNPSLINFSKRVLVSRLITDIQLNQQMSYQLSPIEEAFFLQEFPHIHEKDLYDLSLVREPRGLSAQQLSKMEAD